MTKPQIGQRNWRTAIKQGLEDTREQADRTSQLRQAIRQLLPDEKASAEELNEAYDFILYLMGLLDDLAEIAVSHQEHYQELWEIGQGRPYQDLNNDK